LKNYDADAMPNVRVIRDWGETTADQAISAVARLRLNLRCNQET